MNITEEQIQDLLFNGKSGDLTKVDEVEGENRRWSRTNQVIFKDKEGKFYSVEWEEGLTEEQENEFYEQEAVEVCPVEKVIITWEEAK